MRYLLVLAARSAWNRRVTLGLTLAAIVLSVTMLLAVERARSAARDSFARSIAGTDLIVGARTGPVQLLLYSVFHLGSATHNMRWDSYENLRQHPGVAWSVPLSLGDSHRGMPVVGTTVDYFEHFRFGRSQRLEFASGAHFVSIFDAVVGAEVAASLNYRLGERITLGHGTGEDGAPDHDDKPFKLVGILARTGTPVDRTVLVNLAAIQAIHLDWHGGTRLPGMQIPAEHVRKFDLTPTTITAALFGLKTRASVLQVQRAIHEYEKESLLAVLPAVAFAELWQIVGVVESTLLAISAIIVAISFAGMIAVVWAGLNERRRELAILRSVGAGPRHVLFLVLLEGFVLTSGAILLAYALLALLSLAAASAVRGRFGLDVSAWTSAGSELQIIGVVLAAGLCAALAPAWRACRLALADGLIPRL